MRVQSMTGETIQYTGNNSFLLITNNRKKFAEIPFTLYKTI